MICNDVSDILYPGVTFGKNSCIVCTRLSLLYALEVAHVTLYADNVYWLIMLIGKSDSCHFRGCNIRSEENPSSDPMLSGLLKFTL